MNKNLFKQYTWLFRVNLTVSAFTFGGGYVVVPMLKKYFVTKKQLIAEEELFDIAAIAQSSPGAIAINLSALTGYKIAKLPGALISCTAAILPPLFLLSVISAGYQAFRSSHIVSAALLGMQAGAAALIVDYIVDMCGMILKKKSVFLTFMVPAAFLSNLLLHVNAMLILVICSALCLIRVWLHEKRRCQTCS
ncbi:chromate transporter [Anaerostipes sp.]|uniref:chromate transporter n=1 Tax=Anaerostipes sp. TaxID=1872530 RepID=UPI0025BDB4F5|nr:chromate transporter [Anaerostipes sp.]MBS7009906.1 chromate transporter [Anaerostipes sp.]